MAITVPINTLNLAPGSTVSIDNLSWQDFEAILSDLGEHRCTRLTYYRGTLEIVSPLAIHERPHRIIADIVKVILDCQGRDWEDFGSTTLKRPEIAGVEPDTCLYIQSSQRVRGCTNMDLSIYPPPDLAIESDVTSRTAINAYKTLRVKEVWVYCNHQLTLYVLKGDDYVKTTTSPTFRELPLVNLIPQLVQQAINQGTSSMLRELRSQFNN